jgi:REP element-mobilizing transposase RayT
VAIVENRYSLKTVDQGIYRDLLGEQARKADVEVWAYCLMPNHVHLILNPRQADGLGRAVGEVPSFHLRADLGDEPIQVHK